ncbi:DUF58 domain-containing protein [Paenibacillus hunanensis]|uniref:DUF58 domain-containing protein n=1 Tax=Paenibacillus hunanensis TaxID=539262 RepID=UPI002027317A|nr:DUF58 domain-containing protein [Paenibacillus hunanensis]MCL9660610.1 DUF58 domain-containing protein [Paenibacillus hunanensis]
MRALFSYLRLNMKLQRQPSKLWLVLIVWLGCLFYVLFQGGKTSVMLFSMVTLLAIYLIIGGFRGVGRARGSRKLSIEGDEGSAIHAGDQVQVKLNVTIPGFLPLPYVIVRETLKRHNGESWSFEESLMPSMRGRGELLFQTPPLERGRYRFYSTECISEDIFGLLENRGTFSAPGEFMVLPRTIFIPYWEMGSRHSRLGGQQTSQMLSRPETNQINGVRDYVYGDRISRIHWNATARTGVWKSKEFEHESLPKTILVLDATASHYESMEHFELAVSVTASMLEYGIRERMGMGLFTIGARTEAFVPSDLSSEWHRMQLHLVDIMADGQDGLLKGLEQGARSFPSGSLFVLISPLSGEKAWEVFQFARMRQMLPVQLLIEDQQQEHLSQHWTLDSSARGAVCYPLSQLDQLPTVLGGRAQ